MNRQKNYIKALAIVSQYLGLPVEISLAEMSQEQLTRAYWWLHGANMVELTGCQPDPYYHMTKDQHRVYSGLVKIMWQTRDLAKLKHTQASLYRPNGKPKSFAQTQNLYSASYQGAE